MTAAGEDLYPEHVTTYLLARRAERAPDALVLVDAASGRSWTAAALQTSVGRWAGALELLGVGPGDVVATMLTDQAEGLCAWLGSAGAGAVEAPINPQHRGELLRAALRLVAPRVLVVAPDVLARLGPDELEAGGTVVVTGDGTGATGATGGPGGAVALGPLLASVRAVPEPPPARSSDTAAVISTSGTTGPSKGVVVTWSSVHQLVSWEPDDAYGEGEAVYCALPMFHVAGKSSFTNALSRGSHVVYRQRFAATAFLDDVRAHGCVMAKLVGPMMSFVHETPTRADDADNPLRAVACGPMIPDLEGFERRFGVDVMTCYGMTEIGTVLATDRDHGPWRSCGRVRRDFPWPEIRIVDPEGRDVPPGSVGELVTRTAVPSAFSPGYLHDPDATAAAWRDGWFHSGDAFRVDPDGNHHLVDRLDDAIRRRGENVSSTEVETVVAGHPSVHESAAVGVAGLHGDDDIVIFVVPSPSNLPGAVPVLDVVALARVGRGAGALAHAADVVPRGRGAAAQRHLPAGEEVRAAPDRRPPGALSADGPRRPELLHARRVREDQGRRPRDRSGVAGTSDWRSDGLRAVRPGRVARGRRVRLHRHHLPPGRRPRHGAHRVRPARGPQRLPAPHRRRAVPGARPRPPDHRRRVRAAHRQRAVARGRRLGVLLRRRPAHPRQDGYRYAEGETADTDRSRPAPGASTSSRCSA